jgi:pimeloyl-ACP methyl ester carboxylesterase
MPQTALTDRRFLDLPGAGTAYIESGDGPVLVLIHGVGLNASVWTPQIEAFAGRCRVIAYDTLGHGGSAVPPANASLAHYAAQLGSVLDALVVERAVLLGHSMGALIATLYAIEQPERVDALIAANPVYRRPADQLATSRARARALEEEGAEAALDEALARWFGDAGALDTSQVRQVRHWISGADPLGYARAYRVFTEADPWLDGRLDAIRSPALFVTGALDPNSTPAMARAMAAEAPQGHVRVLDGERHMMAYASPDRFNAIAAEFLDRVSFSDATELPREAKRA